MSDPLPPGPEPMPPAPGPGFPMPEPEPISPPMPPWPEMPAPEPSHPDIPPSGPIELPPATPSGPDIPASQGARREAGNSSTSRGCPIACVGGTRWPERQGEKGEVMPTLRQVRDAMADYVGRIPAGQDSDAWRDFIAETREYLGIDPDGEAATHVDGDADYTAFWLGVAAGSNATYEPATGARRDA